MGALGGRSVAKLPLLKWGEIFRGSAPLPVRLYKFDAFCIFSVNYV